jgi:FixJ family two-component response regulator
LSAPTNRAQQAAAIAELKNRYRRLTPLEQEVFALVSAGLLNKQIAAHLGTAVKTAVSCMNLEMFSAPISPELRERKPTKSIEI